MPIHSSDRVLVVGKTGSGKTYMSRILLADIDHLTIIDTKNSLRSWASDPTAIRRVQEVIGIRPSANRTRHVPPALTDSRKLLKWYDDILVSAYYEGDQIIYIDELFAVVPPKTPAPAGLTALYTRGREMGTGVWACTQRPTWIPLFALSESDHFFCFRLQLDEDRRRMSAFMGNEVLKIPPDPYGFWYYHTAGTMEKAVYYHDIDQIDF